MVEEMAAALSMIEQGDVQKGLQHLEQLESKVNDNEKYELANIYHQLGHSDKAKALLEELYVTYPHDGELLVFLGELAIDQGEEDNALHLLTKVTETDESFIRAQLLLADLYAMQGLEEVAERKLIDAYKRNPDEPVLLAALGDFYLQRGDYGKSIPFLKQVEGKGFEFPSGHLNHRLAEAYSATGQFENALRYYEKGINEIEDPQYLFGYGYTALQLDECDQAIKQLERVKEMDPDFTSVYPYLIEAYERTDNFPEALRVSKEGMAVDEFNDLLFEKAGQVALKSGRKDEGLGYLHEALAINPSNGKAATTLLAYYIDENNIEKVLDLVKTLRQQGEDEPYLDWYEGKALLVLEEDNPIPSFEKAYPFYQEDPDFLEDFGECLIVFGDRKKGIKMWKRSLLLDEQRHHLRDTLESIEMNDEDEW